MSAHTAEKKKTFLAEVIEATPGGERLVHCLQCGSLAAARAPAAPRWSTRPAR